METLTKMTTSSDSSKMVLALLIVLACSPFTTSGARSPVKVSKEDTGLYDYFHPGRVYHLEPQQVHLSYWGDPTQMWVTWVTFDNYTLDDKVSKSGAINSQHLSILFHWIGLFIIGSVSLFAENRQLCGVGSRRITLPFQWHHQLLRWQRQRKANHLHPSCADDKSEAGSEVRMCWLSSL